MTFDKENTTVTSRADSPRPSRLFPPTLSPPRSGVLWPAVVAALLATAASCDRAHLTPSYGRAYHHAFAAQTENPGRAADPRAVHGLDSQEAAIISSNYRRSLSPKDPAAADRPQVLMYSPRTGLREAALPPPSVPLQP